MFKPGLIRTHYRFKSTTLSTNAINLTSKELFLKNLETNPTLSKLWYTKHHTPNPDLINATSTLPIILRTRANVFDDIKKENTDSQGLMLRLKQFTGYAKSIVHFYKVGIQQVWKNNNAVKNIKGKYYIESVDKIGQIQKRRLKNSDDVIDVLSSLQSIEKIEQETIQNSIPTTILNISRSELQTLTRTEQDFYKLPLFALIAVIFAEMTPLVCFLIPEIAPSTCIFPGLLKKKYSSATAASLKLSKIRRERYSESYAVQELPFQSVYKLPVDELRLLVQSLNLKSRYIPVGLYPVSTLRAKLQAQYDKIKVDNHYLINGVDGNNVWGLKKSELIRSCLDRGLLDLSSDDLNHIGAHDLRMRLIFHLSIWNEDKTIGNVGGFGVNNLGLENSIFFQNIGHDEAHKLHSWRNHEHTNEK